MSFQKVSRVLLRVVPAGMLVVLLSVLPLVDAAPAPVLVLTAGELHVGNGEVIADGMVIVKDGRIVDVGTGLPIPDSARLIEMPDGSITPGLIDANAALESSDVMLVSGLSRRRGTRLATGSTQVDARRILHDAFCPTHGRKPVGGCCGSICSRAVRHVEGEACAECGYPNAAPLLAVGTRPGKSTSEQSSEVIPHTRVIDSVNLRSADLRRLLAGGVTTVFVAPDSAAVIGSQGAIVRTGGPIAERIIQATSAVKASMGTDPSWRGRSNSSPYRTRVTFHSRRPTTRMGVTWVFRKAFYDTQRHAKGLKVTGADTPSDAALDTLQRVLDHEIPLRIQARTLPDIITALRLADEFGLSFTLEEATEAYRCLDELKAHGTPVIYGPIYIRAPGYRAGSAEVGNARLHTMKALLDAGIETALTAHELRDEDGLARQAMYALRAGVSLAQVTRSVTETPARLLGLGDRIGTIEKGKQADLVVWTGKPFEAASKPATVLIGGEVVLTAAGESKRKG